MTRPIRIRATLTACSMRCLLALACTSILAAQEPVAGELDPASLTLDALIERLPTLLEERVKVGDEFRVHPLTAELGRRLQSGAALSGAQWERVLFGSDALRWPRRWPVGVPLAVSARIPGWLGDRTVLVLDPQQAPLRRARVGAFETGTMMCGLPLSTLVHDLRHQELGELPLGRHQIEFRLKLRRAAPAEGWFGLYPWLPRYLAREPDAERGVPADVGLEPRLPPLLSTSALELEVEIVPTLDDAVTPVQTPELEAAVRRSLDVVFSGSGQYRQAYLRSRFLPELEGVGLALEIKVLHRGEVLERQRLHAGGFENLLWTADRYGYGTALYSIPRRLEDDLGMRRAWKLKVSGTDFEILQPWTDRRWTGKLELTLDELLERGERIEDRR